LQKRPGFLVVGHIEGRQLLSWSIPSAAAPLEQLDAVQCQHAL
jgi:hypothetical protein